MLTSMENNFNVKKKAVAPLLRKDSVGFVMDHECQRYLFCSDSAFMPTGPSFHAVPRGMGTFWGYLLNKQEASIDITMQRFQQLAQHANTATTVV